MGDVVSSHLDETRRELITARTGAVMAEFGRLYEQQYGLALFNKVRFDLEGGGGPQSQLLQRKIPLENKSIFSGSIFHYVEESKKWRNRFLFVPDSYNINCYENKASFDKHLQPKGTINCAGSKVLTSVEQYLELVSDSLPDVKAKAGSSPFLKTPSQFPVMVWHPYTRHQYFCLSNEKEQQKWQAVLQDCVRHTNDGLCEEEKVQTPAFTDAVRLYRQAQGNYGTWEMMCGVPSQILSNLVMETLHPELKEIISPRLKGKLHDRQRSWMLISDAVYSLVQEQCVAHYEALLQKCEVTRSSLEASIRKDMDQIIASKDHITSKVKAVVLSKAEKLLKVSIQPYISSILDALMEPTSRGFFEVRDVFFRELTEMSKNTLNKETKETVAQHMEKISMLPYHPVKMQSCYEKVEQLSLEGLQHRFDVSSPSVFVQRAQILMRQQMDNAVFTFEHILHQSLESQGPEDLCQTIQRCQDRVLKKFDYDSSTVRKRFFREALLQIFIPYMLKQLSPSCASELPGFQELIFEDFCRFILVENIFEEVVLLCVMKDIMTAVKEAAVQRKHNLFRDSIVLSNSDPNLHLLVEKPSIDWARKYGGAQENPGGPGENTENEEEDAESKKSWRMKQVVSMIQVTGSSLLPGQSSMEVPSSDVIQEETDGNLKKSSDNNQNGPEQRRTSEIPPDTASGADLKREAKLDNQSKENEATVAATLSEESKAKDSQPGVEEQSASSKQLKTALPLSPIAEELLPGAQEVTPEHPSDMSNGTGLNQEDEPREQGEEDKGAVTAITDGVEAKHNNPEAKEPPAPSKEVVESKPQSPTSEEIPSGTLGLTLESASDEVNGSDVKLEEPGTKDEAEVIVNVGEVNLTKKDEPEVKEPPSSQVVESVPLSPADEELASSNQTPESAPDLTNGSEIVQEAKPEDEAAVAAGTEDLPAKDTESGVQEPPASSKEVVESKPASPAAEAMPSEALAAPPKITPDNANHSDLKQEVKLGASKEDDQKEDGAATATMSKDNKPEVKEPPSSQVVESVPISPADEELASSNQTPESAPDLTNGSEIVQEAKPEDEAAVAEGTEDLPAKDTESGVQEPPASSKEVVESKPASPAAEAMPSEALAAPPKITPDNANHSDLKQEVKLGASKEDDQKEDGAETATMSKDNKPEVKEPPSSQVVESVPISPADEELASSNQTPDSVLDLTNGSEIMQETKPEDEAAVAAGTVFMDEELTASGVQEPPASSKEVVESKPASPAAEAMLSPAPEINLETPADSSLPPLNSCTQSSASKAVDEGEAATSCTSQTQLVEEEAGGAAGQKTSHNTEAREQ